MNLTSETRNGSSSYEGESGLSIKVYASIGISLVFAFLSVVANVIVLVILRKKGNRRTVFDLTIASLFTTDLLAASCYLSFVVLHLSVFYLGRRQPFFSRFSIYLAGFFFVLSLLHVLFITVQRLYAIFYPLKCRQVMTKTRVKYLIILLWTISLSILPVFFLQTRTNPLFGILIFSTGGMLCFLYVIITVKVYKLLKTKRFDWHKEHRILLNSTGVTLSFFACLSPYGYASISRSMSKDFTFYASFVSINFLFDPLLYFYFSYWLSRRDAQRSRRSDHSKDIPVICGTKI